MTLEEAYHLFENLKNETSKKSEVKLFNEFLYILGKMKSRAFTKDEIQSIESELDRLNLRSNPEKGIKYFRKALYKFEKYLKDTFSLISKGYYTRMGVGLGSSFGIVFGIVFLSNMERSGGIALGLSFGMLIGVVIGRSMDAKAKSEDRVL